LLVFSLHAWLLVRTEKNDSQSSSDVAASPSITLQQALLSPAFWVFAGGASLYGLVASGLGLYHESILKDLQFTTEDYHNVLAISTLCGLVGQGICGAASLRVSLHRLLAAALFVYAGALAFLPHVRTWADVVGYAVTMGAAGGFVTVLFFGAWSRYFGAASVGKIIGAAQMLTVFASAVGPLVFSECRSRFGSYTPALQLLAVVVTIVAVFAFSLRQPTLQAESERNASNA
jgi:hypothetical protein